MLTFTYLKVEGIWFDWWTGEKYTGSTHILAHASLERMPLYARAGAIIPMQPVMQYVDERSLNELRLRIFPGIGEYKLYEDDGHSFDGSKGSLRNYQYMCICRCRENNC
jgi:alpha-glucosidase